MTNMIRNKWLNSVFRFDLEVSMTDFVYDVNIMPFEKYKKLYVWISSPFLTLSSKPKAYRKTFLVFNPFGKMVWP